MKPALTETVWLKTLDRIANATSSDDMTRTLAKMLWEIIYDPTDIADVLDAYGSRLLEQP
jgi:hypothetical protein